MEDIYSKAQKVLQREREAIEHSKKVKSDDNIPTVFPTEDLRDSQLQ